MTHFKRYYNACQQLLELVSVYKRLQAPKKGVRMTALSTIHLQSFTMPRKLPAGRKPMGGSGGSERLPTIYASEDFAKKTASHAAALGMGFSEFGRVALERFMEEEAPNPNEISFELTQKDADELQKLADALYYEDPNFFAKVVIRRALDMGPDLMREFLLGQAKREVAAILAEENDRRAEKEAKPTRTRKAA